MRWIGVGAGRCSASTTSCDSYCSRSEVRRSPSGPLGERPSGFATACVAFLQVVIARPLHASLAEVGYSLGCDSRMFRFVPPPLPCSRSCSLGTCRVVDQSRECFFWGADWQPSIRTVRSSTSARFTYISSLSTTEGGCVWVWCPCQCP